MCLTGSKEVFDEPENKLLNQIREKLNDDGKSSEKQEAVEPANIGKKVAENVENHSTDTKRGELN